MAKNIVYFDLETQKSADEVGGWDKISAMGMSVGVTYNTATGGYRIYHEKQVDELIKESSRQQQQQQQQASGRQKSQPGQAQPKPQPGKPKGQQAAKQPGQQQQQHGHTGMHHIPAALPPGPRRGI